MIKTIGKDENISVGDPVQFVLETYDGSGCLIVPYQVRSATIYFVNREFTDTTASEYRAEFTDGELQAEYERAKQEACLKAKQTVKASSTANLALSGLASVDGVGLTEGDRVLAKDQTDRKRNGIYFASAGAWRRSSDMLEGSTVASGSYVFVENGISNIGTGWMLGSPDDRVAGSDELAFVQFATDWKPESPGGSGQDRLSVLRQRLESSKVASSFFYKDATAVRSFGGSTDPVTKELFPAWLNPDAVPSSERSKVISENILVRAEDDDGEVVGKFILEWSTDGAREGDYFICWSWRPTVGDEILSAHQLFHLGGNDYATTSIPTHRSRSEKYEMLLDRYTPEMFKTRISDSDLAPEVMSEFGKAVAKGFTFVENQANAVIDLLDSNATHEQFLPALGNMFNLKIKSGDPTLWRRQIKKAVPNFKKKGSILGLKEALGDAGMSLLRLSRMWQVVPKYTWQEHFVYGESNQFILSKTPASQSDFTIWFRSADKDSEWTMLASGGNSSSSSSSSGGYISVSGNAMSWDMARLALKKGDSVRVMYPFRTIPSGERAKEDYIRSLPLMDDRDERLQEYPPKNWNLHLVEEDDEYFDLLVPVRHPFSDPIIWGRIRTEFPYSENLYNMEEYNGSKRDSLNPCDIDKEFMDSCGQCASSKFNMDVEIDMLSDERFRELNQVVQEYMPFHAVPNSFGLWGGINEFVGQTEESVKAMIHYSREDVTISGEGQNIFSRDVYSSDLQKVKRNLLADNEVVANPGGGDTWSGSIRNHRVLLLPRATYAETDLENEEFDGLTGGFDSYNIKLGTMESDPFENDNLLEKVGSTTKYYSVSSVGPEGAEVHGGADQADIGPLFEYRLSNLIGDFNVDVTQHEEVVFEDIDADFFMLGIVSQRDVDDGVAAGPVWRLLFQNGEYSVLDVLPDGKLLLDRLSTISPVSGWELKQGSVLKRTGTGGSKTTKNYGLVEINTPSVEVRKAFASGDYVYMGWPSAISRHRIKSFQKGTERFYMQDYSGGNAGGVEVKVYRRVLDGKIGQFGCDTLKLTAVDDLGSIDDPEECMAEVIAVNGNPITPSEYYIISDVAGHLARISGAKGSYGTSPTSVQFKVRRFTKNNLILSEKQVPPYDERPPEYEFAQAGRSGEAIITSSQGAGMGALSSLLNSSEPIDVMKQDEEIRYNIEYKEKK